MLTYDNRTIILSALDTQIQEKDRAIKDCVEECNIQYIHDYLQSYRKTVEARTKIECMEVGE